MGAVLLDFEVDTARFCVHGHDNTRYVLRIKRKNAHCMATNETPKGTTSLLIKHLHEK